MNLTPINPVHLRQDSSGAPAVDLSKLHADGHVDLVKRARKAGISLSKRGLSGMRAQAVLVLDHSGSMSGDYRSGKVQVLVERALGFALQIDIDGVIPVIPFDSDVLPTVTVGVGAGRAADGTPVEPYQGVVDRSIHRSRMGSTNLTAALRAVRAMATTAKDPLFVVVVTDGAPDHRKSATDLVAELSRYPVFLKFVGVRDSSYLEFLDTAGPDRLPRLVDAVNTQIFPDLSGMTDLAFADAMADEWDLWVGRATAAGILR